MALIETLDLVKHYPGVTALDSLSFSVEPGSIGLVGPNGAGKSTLIKILLGLVPASSGRAHVLDTDTACDSIHIRELVGYLPEHDCLPGDLTASNFVVHMARMSGIPASAARERTAETLRHVGLYDERYRQMSGYSTGMKQRVKLAQALVHDPRLLFLDEPTNGLDPAGRDEMLELIQHTGKEFGVSIVMSSHLLGEIERVCETLIVIEEGKLMQVGRISDLTNITSVLLAEVDERAEELAEKLRENGLTATVDGRQIALEIGPERIAVAQDLIVQSSVDLNLSLLRLEQRRRRLEDLFEAATPPRGTRQES